MNYYDYGIIVAIVIEDSVWCIDSHVGLRSRKPGKSSMAHDFEAHKLRIVKPSHYFAD